MIFRLLFCSIVPACAALAEDNSFRIYDAFLQKYVCMEGVDYARILHDNALVAPRLELTLIDSSTYGAFSGPGKIAYLINVYNFFTIGLVVNRLPPISSIQDIHKPWDSAFVPLFGRKVSLNYIENTLLRKQFHEPRIHFALVCASKSCPALYNRAYLGSNLDRELTEAAKTFLADPAKNRVDDTTLNLSQIFNWYGDDFKKNHGNYQKFVLKTLRLKGTFAIKFLDYDWRLNNAECVRPANR